MQSNLFINFFYKLAGKYPTPSNLSYLWNFGLFLLIVLVIQVITGIILVFYYIPHIDYLVYCVKYMLAYIMGIYENFLNKAIAFPKSHLIPLTLEEQKLFDFYLIIVEFLKNDLTLLFNANDISFEIYEKKMKELGELENFLKDAKKHGVNPDEHYIWYILEHLDLPVDDS
jgi:hypothetical protein